MSYCPEDGVKMDKVSEQAGGVVTYQCPECKTLWHYFDGAYQAEMTAEEAVVAEALDRFAERRAAEQAEEDGDDA